jgi:hypothetical protein
VVLEILHLLVHLKAIMAVIRVVTPLRTVLAAVAALLLLDQMVVDQAAETAVLGK